MASCPPLLVTADGRAVKRVLTVYDWSPADKERTHASFGAQVVTGRGARSCACAINHS